MVYVLGIDAAWTETNPSGVALIRCDDNIMELVRVGRGYTEFIKRDRINWQTTADAGIPNIKALLNTCSDLGCPVDVISLDIPLSPLPIVGRRGADSAISKAYGGRAASTHTPGFDRPGPISDHLFSQLTNNGYRWADSYATNGVKLFLETYPHPAIIELCGLDYRLKYKVDKRLNYWRSDSPYERSRKLIANLSALRTSLSAYIGNVDQFVPKLEPTASYSTKLLKGFEDVLDAMVSAIVGCLVARGKAKAYGDKDSVIWVPDRDKFTLPEGADISGIIEH